MFPSKDTELTRESKIKGSLTLERLLKVSPASQVASFLPILTLLPVAWSIDKLESANASLFVSTVHTVPL
jgi:hypothetical protein